MAPVESELPLTNSVPELQGFFEAVKKASSPCPEDDCDEIKSPCCNAVVSTVFATIPLEVKCSMCGATYVLRELLK